MYGNGNKGKVQLSMYCDGNKGRCNSLCTAMATRVGATLYVLQKQQGKVQLSIYVKRH